MAELITLPGVKGTFIAGLSWRHEDDVPRASELAVRSRLSGRWGAVWNTSSGAVQAGFCELPEDVRKPRSLRVLAAIVAGQRAAPWLGLFEIDEDRYWLIAVSRGHEIIPDGDACGSLHEMLSLRDRHLALGEWTPFEGDLTTLAAMVESSPTNLVLRDLQRKPWASAAYVGGAVAAALTVVGGGYAWQHHREVERQKAEHARQVEIFEALQARRDAEANVLPWTREAIPSEVSRACGDAWAEQDLAVGSWTLNGWHCEAGEGSHGGVSITTDWVGGLAADAPGRLSDNAKQARLSAHLRRSFSTGSSYALPDADAKRALWTFAQRYGFGLNIQTQRENSDLPGETSKTPEARAWSKSTATLTFDAPPWTGWAGDLDHLPGVRLKQVSWSAKAATGAKSSGNADVSSAPLWQATLTLYTLNTASQAPKGGHGSTRGANRHPHGAQQKAPQ